MIGFTLNFVFGGWGTLAQGGSAKLSLLAGGTTDEEESLSCARIGSTIEICACLTMLVAGKRKNMHV